jgi:beta-galactosidase GanA
MKKSTYISCLLIFSFVFLNAQNKTGRTSTIPRLSTEKKTIQLIVDDKPFLMLAGELGNSSSSDLEYLKPIWPKLVKMNLNTVLVPVYWEMLEPREGTFDFILVDSMINSARQYQLKLVLLWFGSWKNSMSCYVPSWVKTDQKRFPRVRTKEGKAEEILTPFAEVNTRADAIAFAQLMRHIRTIDETKNTVIMVQVENEIGMIPDAREYSDLANKAFTEKVPQELMIHLQKHKSTLEPDLQKLWAAAGYKSSGTWEEVFGKSLQTDEIFMAWYFAKYTNVVALAGKKEYSLPMYVNAALIRPNYSPGQYPSGGPLPHLLDIWKAAAPDIDFLSPDIYFKSFAEWSGKYDRPNNPLFIPEADNAQSIANAFYVFARHNALGYSPFSIESPDDSRSNHVANGYDVLNQLQPLILEQQGKGTMMGVLLDSANQSDRIQLGRYVFNCKHEFSWRYAFRAGVDTPRVGGLIIMLAPDEFLFAGNGLIITVDSKIADGTTAGFDSIDEGRFDNGKWVPGRRLNGDQSHQGRHVHLPGGLFSIQRIKLYTYK